MCDARVLEDSLKMACSSSLEMNEGGGAEPQSSSKVDSYLEVANTSGHVHAAAPPVPYLDACIPRPNTCDVEFMHVFGSGAAEPSKIRIENSVLVTELWDLFGVRKNGKYVKKSKT